MLNSIYAVALGYALIVFMFMSWLYERFFVKHDDLVKAALFNVVAAILFALIGIPLIFIGLDALVMSNDCGQTICVIARVAR